MMEVIARINDLACRSIEMGHYQTSLDVLNCCLGCVKQLKNERTKMENRKNQADARQKSTKESILRMLKGAERKITKLLSIGGPTSTRGGASDAVVSTTYGNKRKAPTFVPSKLTDTNQSTMATTSRGKDVFSRTHKKRRRHMYPDNSSMISSSVSTNAKSNMTCSSQEPECHCSNTLIGCSDSIAIPSRINSTVRNAQTHNQSQHLSQSFRQKNYKNEVKEQVFIHCKPFRLTKFQWSRVDKYLFSSTSQTNPLELEKEKKEQSRIDREVELAVSSNLIFNIALAHHLVACSQEQKEKASQRLLCDHDDSEDEFETNDENAFQDESTYYSDSSSCTISSCNSSGSSEDEAAASNVLRNEERLRGALRLYELGFRIHTKRVAYVTALETISSMPGSMRSSSASVTSFYPSSTSTNVSATTTPMTALQEYISPPRLEGRSISSSSSSSSSSFSSQVSESSNRFILRSDRDAELKSTTRFALALLNNCAHIHETLGQADNAKVFKKRLLSFLMVIVDSGESIHDIIGDQPAVDGFLKNVFAGTVFDKDTAPAAVA